MTMICLLPMPGRTSFFAPLLYLNILKLFFNYFSKNLENLFNVSMQPKETDELPSLKYVAPKQSLMKANTSEQNQEANHLNKVIIAKRITAYQFM